MLLPANPCNCTYVSFPKGEYYGSKKIQFEKQVQFQQEEEFRFKKEIERPQVRQEGEPGSAHRDASHALRQAQGKEPQAGYCDRAFKSKEKRRESAAKKIVIKSQESGLKRHDNFSDKRGECAAGVYVYPLNAVIFDIDGTLTDSVDIHAMAWREALQKFRHDVPYERVRKQIGKGGDQLLQTVLSRADLEDHGEELDR